MGWLRKHAAYPLLTPGMAWLLIFFFVPMGFMFVKSLQTVTVDETFHQHYTLTWEWSNYTEAIRTYHSQFVRSFLYAGIATVAAFLIAYPLAYVIAFRAGRWKNLLLLLVIAPFFTNYLIRTLAWGTLLADDSIVTRALDAIGFLTVTDALGWTSEHRLLATPFAVVAAITYNYLAFMILPLYVSLEKIDKRLIEAATDLYSSYWRAFRKVILPLSMPGVFAGTLLCFIPAVGDFINAKLLGNTNTQVIGEVVQSRFLNQNDYPTAAAISFVVMVIITAIVLVYARFLGTEDLV